MPLGQLEKWSFAKHKAQQSEQSVNMAFLSIKVYALNGESPSRCGIKSNLKWCQTYGLHVYWRSVNIILPTAKNLFSGRQILF